MKEKENRFKGILTYRLPLKAVAVIACIVLAVLLVPLFRIAAYSVPWYDDYNYGNFVKNFVELERSLSSALQGAAYCIKTQWHAWQGTFSSIFFMSMIPSVWGDQYYFLGPVLIITILVIAAFSLVKVLVRDVIKADLSTCIILQAATAAFLVVMIYSPQVGFFWYNAGVHYVLTHSFCILMVAAFLKLLVVQNKAVTGVLVVSGMVGAVISSGANFVTSLQGLVLTISIVLLGILLRNKRTFLLLPALCVYVYGFYMNVSAPGNDKRAAFFVGQGKGPVKSIVLSFVEAVKHIATFTDWMTIAFMILLLPVIWGMVQKSSLKFSMPLAVLLWSVCVYATGFTPSLYSMGHAGLGRTLNAVKITYQLLLLMNEVYLLGWFCRFLEKKKKKTWDGKCYWWFYGLVAATMLLIFAVDSNKEGSYSSYGAYKLVHSGVAYNFYQEYLDRIEDCQKDEANVVVKPYAWNPWMLKVGDLTDNPGSEQNAAMAKWYRKESIVCTWEASE